MRGFLKRDAEISLPIMGNLDRDTLDDSVRVIGGRTKGLESKPLELKNH